MSQEGTTPDSRGSRPAPPLNQLLVGLEERLLKMPEEVSRAAAEAMHEVLGTAERAVEAAEKAAGAAEKASGALAEAWDWTGSVEKAAASIDTFCRRLDLAGKDLLAPARRGGTSFLGTLLTAAIGGMVGTALILVILVLSGARISVR